MNWDDLKLFLAVSRDGTISGAAKQFNVQHSTVSRRLKNLERDLGVSLFHRVNNRYELSEEGKKIESAAIRMECEVLGFDGALSGKNDSLVGVLRVSTISTLASTILAPVFGGFCRQYPQIKLQVSVSNKVVSLINREADIVIRMTNTPPEALIGKRLATVASAVYGSREYFKDEHHLKHPSWLGAKCCGFHDTWTKQSCDSNEHQFLSDDAQTILSAVREGLGVTYLPCFIGDAEPSLQRFRDPQTQFELGLWVLSHPESNHNARVLAFRKHLIQAVQTLRPLIEGEKPQA